MTDTPNKPVRPTRARDKIGAFPTEGAIRRRAAKDKISYDEAKGVLLDECRSNSGD